MKKSILLLFAAVMFLSCDNVQVSSMVMQANLNADFFRAYSVSAQANNTNQMMTIVGYGSNSELLKLHTEWKGAGVYKVGENEVNYATYKSADDRLYTTKSEGSSGEITITNQNEGDQSLTGEFNFTIITANDTITVSRGMLYGVPYTITGD